MSVFENLHSVIKKEIPGFEVRYKTDSTLMKVLGLLLRPFNPGFQTDFITTIYPIVYYPSPNEELSSEILAHEFVHLWDNKKSRWGFSLGYLFPQILALPLLLGAIPAGLWVSGWVALVMVLLGLLALAPWPARWRAEAEYRGYAMSLAWDYWRTGHISNDTVSFIAEQFYGWNYYRMDPVPGRVTDKLVDIVALIESGKILEGDDAEPYRIVHRFLSEKKLIKV